MARVRPKNIRQQIAEGPRQAPKGRPSSKPTNALAEKMKRGMAGTAKPKSTTVRDAAASELGGQSSAGRGGPWRKNRRKTLRDYLKIGSFFGGKG